MQPLVRPLTRTPAARRRTASGGEFSWQSTKSLAPARSGSCCTRSDAVRVSPTALRYLADYPTCGNGTPLTLRRCCGVLWFGVLVIVTAEVGMLTPPVGLNVFVVARYSGSSPEEVFRGVWPHVFAHLLLIGAFVLFPQLVLWLPSRM